MYRDTVPVSGKGGYTIIRFKADNPGKIYTFMDLVRRPDKEGIFIANGTQGLQIQKY